MSEDPPIQTLDSRVVYENRWLRLREDKIRHADGSEGIYSVVDKAPFALIIPCARDQVYLVGQWRYTVQEFCWEFPQGALDGQPDVPMDEVARIELAEETGLRAGRIAQIGQLYTAYGHSNQTFSVFVATDLSPGEAAPEPGEIGMQTRPVTRAELERMIRDGELRDSHSVAAYQLLRMRD